MHERQTCLHCGPLLQGAGDVFGNIIKSRMVEHQGCRNVQPESRSNAGLKLDNSHRIQPGLVGRGRMLGVRIRVSTACCPVRQCDRCTMFVPSPHNHCLGQPTTARHRAHDALCTAAKTAAMCETHSRRTHLHERHMS